MQGFFRKERRKGKESFGGFDRQRAATRGAPNERGYEGECRPFVFEQFPATFRCGEGER